MKSCPIRSVLIGMGEIAEACGVGRRRVYEWRDKGAPIYRDERSGRWLAHVDELWQWRKNNELSKTCQ